MKKKKKCMVFNFTRKDQFSKRLTLNGKALETVKEIQLLGTIITDNLKWDKNTFLFVKSADARMEPLRTTVSGLHPCWWRVCYQRSLSRLVFTSW